MDAQKPRTSKAIPCVRCGHVHEGPCQTKLRDQWGTYSCSCPAPVHEVSESKTFKEKI